MVAFKLNLDVEPSQDYLNKLVRVTITRIRRCIAVKSVALEKIRGDTQEARVYGFSHLVIALYFQKRSYERYIKFIEQFQAIATVTREEAAAMPKLESGFLDSWVFSNKSRNVVDNIILTERTVISVKNKMRELLELVEAQIKMLGIDLSNTDNPFLKKRAAQIIASSINIYGNEEVKLRQIISYEIRQSEALINELNKCMETLFRLSKAISVLITRFMQFVNRLPGKKSLDILKDFQALCDKIEKNLSRFYLLKFLIVVGGGLLAFFAPFSIIKSFGAVAAVGMLILDFGGDTVAAIPAAKRSIHKMKGKIDEEEINLRRRIEGVLISLKQSSTELAVG